MQKYPNSFPKYFWLKEEFPKGLPPITAAIMMGEVHVSVNSVKLLEDIYINKN